MFLVDTSILIAVLRDRSGGNADRLLAEVGDGDIVVDSIIAGEILAGAKDDAEWKMLQTYLGTLIRHEVQPDAWEQSARIFFDARRNGTTIRKFVDCCIAQSALTLGATLVHDDKDFEAIAAVRPLVHLKLSLAFKK